jgi:hypothetical protein
MAMVIIWAFFAARAEPRLWDSPGGPIKRVRHLRDKREHPASAKRYGGNLMSDSSNDSWWQTMFKVYLPN